MTTLSAPVRLTQYAAGGGCACKLPPGELEQVVRDLAGQAAGDVVVGLDTGDDGAVVRIADGVAVISTADFFTPVVDDAFDFGRIVAANALSDVYAMGGRPVVAINLVGWPRSVLPLELLREVLRGGLAVAREAGCPVAGGHSIDDPEPKYGMAVTGVADPDRLLRNDAARPGLPLSLTKPIGVGMLNNRHKATGEVFPQAIASMTTLNAAASAAALSAGASAATDVTGFGLLGHLRNMLAASGVAATIALADVPVLEAAWTYVREGVAPGGTHANKRFLDEWVTYDDAVDKESRLVLCDAQTSGGLLMAVAPEKAEALVAALEARGTPCAAVVGRVEAGEAGRMHVIAGDGR